MTSPPRQVTSPLKSIVGRSTAYDGFTGLCANLLSVSPAIIIINKLSVQRVLQWDFPLFIYLFIYFYLYLYSFLLLNMNIIDSMFHLIHNLFL